MKKKYLKTGCIIFLLVFLLFQNMEVISWAADNPARQGVVPVVFYLKDVTVYGSDDFVNFKAIGKEDEYRFSYGSGFFIGEKKENPSYIVTNCHVIEKYLASEEGGDFRYVVRYDTDGDMYYDYAEAYVAKSCELRIYYDDDDYDVAYVDCQGDVNKVDLAVLRLRESTDKRKALSIMSPDEVGSDETVYAIGFPGIAYNDYTNASHYGMEDSSITRGGISRIVAASGTGVERVEMDVKIAHGNSGGPLVTGDGTVVGVNTNGYADASELEQTFYAISGTELMRFLDKNNIPYMTGTGPDPIPTPDGFLGFIIAGVVIVAIIVALLLWKKPWLKPPKKEAYVNSLSKRYNTGKVLLGSQQIMIGRDQQKCKICYPDRTPGVSNHHATLYFDMKYDEFVLVDLQSSYGTYLSTGMRLTPKVAYRLKPGDRFFLGKENSDIQLMVDVVER